MNIFVQNDQRSNQTGKRNYFAQSNTTDPRKIIDINGKKVVLGKENASSDY